MRKGQESSEKMLMEDKIMCLREKDMPIPSVLISVILSGYVWL